MVLIPRALFILGAAPLAALLLSSAPARADRCGSAIVGVAACAGMTLSRAELAVLKAKALKGDRDAAAELMFFYADLKGGQAESRRWKLLAAERGSCQAIEWLHREAGEDRKPAEARKWEQRARWNKCNLDPLG